MWSLRGFASVTATLADLSRLRDVTGEQLGNNPIERAAAERFVQVIVDLAVDVNGHLLVALTGAAPVSGRASFSDLSEQVDVLPVDLAQRLAPSAGMRNLLVHRYGTIDVALVAAGVTSTLEWYPSYVSAVSRWLERSR